MERLRRLCAAVVLTLAFTLPAVAGGMHTPAPTPPSAPATPLTQGDMHTPRGPMDTGPGATATTADSFTGAILSLLEGVLALF